MNKRPVHIVCETGSLAGGVRVIGEIANRLADRDWPVAIWSVNPKETLTSWFRLDTRVKWYSFLKSGTTNDYGPMADILKKQDGIKIATFWRTAFATSDASKDGEGFFLVQDVETAYTTQPIYGQLVMSTYAMPLRKITTSRWVEKQIPDTTWVGIGLDNSLRPNPKVRRERFILACARIQALKGWDTLCEAYRYLEAGGGKLVTFGLDKELPMAAKSEHISKPTDADIRHLYQRAGVFLSQSAHEGLNLTLLEAMACGAPCSTTNSDGNMEYVDDGENCLLAEGNDPYELASNCARILGDKDLSKKLSENGPKTAQRYKWGPVLDRIEAVFME